MKQYKDKEKQLINKSIQVPDPIVHIFVLSSTRVINQYLENFDEHLNFVIYL